MTVLNLFLSLSVGSFCCCCKFASSARKSFLSELKRFLSELKRASSVCKRFLFARRRTASSFKCANCFFFFFTKIDRAVLTHHPHPVRHNRSACFITKIFELELPKSENTYRAESTLVISHMCVCVLAFLRMCVCVCVRSRTCLLECKCIPQSARPCHSSARPCHRLAFIKNKTKR